MVLHFSSLSVNISPDSNERAVKYLIMSFIVSHLREIQEQWRQTAWGGEWQNRQDVAAVFEGHRNVCRPLSLFYIDASSWTLLLEQPHVYDSGFKIQKEWTLGVCRSRLSLSWVNCVAETTVEFTISLNVPVLLCIFLILWYLRQWWHTTNLLISFLKVY